MLPKATAIKSAVEAEILTHVFTGEARSEVTGHKGGTVQDEAGTSGETAHLRTGCNWVKLAVVM